MYDLTNKGAESQLGYQENVSIGSILATTQSSNIGIVTKMGKVGQGSDDKFGRQIKR